MVKWVNKVLFYLLLGLAKDACNISLKSSSSEPLQAQMRSFDCKPKITRAFPHFHSPEGGGPRSHESINQFSKYQLSISYTPVQCWGYKIEWSLCSLDSRLDNRNIPMRRSIKSSGRSITVEYEWEETLSKSRVHVLEQCRFCHWRS